MCPGQLWIKGKTIPDLYEEEEVDTDGSDTEEEFEEEEGSQSLYSHLAHSMPSMPDLRRKPPPTMEDMGLDPDNDIGGDSGTHSRSPLKRIVCPICTHSFANKVGDLKA